MADATQLLTKKLYGVNESTKHVITPHSWLVFIIRLILLQQMNNNNNKQKFFFF